MTYVRLNNLTQSEFCDEMFDASRHIVNLDFAHAYSQTRKHALQFDTDLEKHGDWHQIKPKNAPENYGFNAIRLQTPTVGQTVTIDFEGFANSDGSKYVIINPEDAGWRYGFVAIDADGKSHYGAMGSDAKGQISFTADFDVRTLWLVVMGAPQKHWTNPSPDANSDAQWPYRYKLRVTNLNADRTDL